jgi:hypothetical protein
VAAAYPLADVSRPHALYRFFGSGGTLLYIGITNALPTRLRRHNDEKPWWTGVADIKVEHFPDRPTVLLAEKRAIIAERPLYNIQHNTVDQFTPSVTASGLAAVCMSCHEIVPAYAVGALHVDMSEVRTAEAGRMGWADRHGDVCTLGELLDGHPEPATWRTDCDDCLDHREHDCDSCYSIETSRCTTWAELLAWTVHLSGKPWLVATNWMSLIGEIAEGTRTAALVPVAESVTDDTEWDF